LKNRKKDLHKVTVLFSQSSQGMILQFNSYMLTSRQATVKPRYIAPWCSLFTRYNVEILFICPIGSHVNPLRYNVTFDVILKSCHPQRNVTCRFHYIKCKFTETTCPFKRNRFHVNRACHRMQRHIHVHIVLGSSPTNLKSTKPNLKLKRVSSG
jgi:hypothetical protein